MSSVKTVTTSKGNDLPLINLKGKDYLMVAYRLQWLAEDVPKYLIDTSILTSDAEHATVKATIVILDNEGKVVRKASATKTEERKSFPDFMEKAETGSIGRALAMLGFGTQHALADLDEGARIVDSPLTAVKSQQIKVAKTGTSKKGDF